MESDDSGFTWSTKPLDIFKKGLNGLTDNNDPTYLGFVFLFDFNNSNNSPLLVNDTGKKGTAVNYLDRIGETGKRDYLINFINNLQAINRRMPWYWQSIEGVNQLWEFENFNDPYRGTIGNDKKLTISCLESLDLRITMIMDLYRKAAYDLEFRRMVLPENLQRFRVWLYVQEIRKFNDFGGTERVSKIDVPNLSGVPSDPINAVTNSITDPQSDENKSQSNKYPNKNKEKPSVNEKSPYVLFRLEGCHWITDDSSGFLSNLSNSEPEQSTQQVSFRWENVVEEGNKYPLSNIQVGNKNKPKNDSLQEVRDTFITNAASNASSFTENRLEAQLSSAVLGNVYGISPSNLQDALTQASVQSLGFEVQNEISSRLGVGNIAQLYNDPFVNNRSDNNLNSDNIY